MEWCTFVGVKSENFFTPASNIKFRVSFSGRLSALRVRQTNDNASNFLASLSRQLHKIDRKPRKLKLAAFCY